MWSLGLLGLNNMDRSMHHCFRIEFIDHHVHNKATAPLVVQHLLKMFLTSPGTQHIHRLSSLTLYNNTRDTRDND